MKIAIGSDHRGFKLKEIIKIHLNNKGYDVVDVGPFKDEIKVDYPDFAYKVAELVSLGECDRGIMIDGAGVGSAIVANKVSNIRAVNGSDYFIILNSRLHNDTNVLTLGSEVSGEYKTIMFVDLWLSTKYEGGRHQVRIDKITNIESMFSVNLKKIGELVKRVLESINSSIKLNNKNTKDYSDKFITLNDLKDFSDGEFHLKKGQYLTPAALDYLKERGVKIVK